MLTPSWKKQRGRHSPIYVYEMKQNNSFTTPDPNLSFLSNVWPTMQIQLILHQMEVNLKKEEIYLSLYAYLLLIYLPCIDELLRFILGEASRGSKVV